MALSQLVCLGRHTVTGVICASGRQFEDWSADYNLFSKERFDKEKTFDGAGQPPKWRKKQKPRLSTQDLIAQLWGKAIGYEGFWGKENAKELNDTDGQRIAQDNFRGFRETPAVAQNPRKLNPHLPSAVLYATG